MLKCYSNSNETWNRIYDATFAFNVSNSDSGGIVQSFEMVLTIGAFERLLGLRGGNGKELSRAFSDILKEVPIVTELEELKRLRIAPQDNATIRETWIRDFLIVRNDLAHGKRHSTYKASWTLQEHLLLASYIFPLVVKLVLNKEGAYNMSDTDRLAIYSFDYLLHTNNLFVPRMHNGTNSFPWRMKLTSANLNWIRNNNNIE